jgi:NAD(P)-dependent dehydrogenase (short-subunit alcohol dehydrogenase family)
MVEKLGSRLGGRRLLVTGAARGIGRAVAVRAAAEGAAVGVLDVSEEGLGDVADAVRSTGADVAVVVADVADAGQCAAAVTAVAEQLGGLDGLVNNAGVLREQPLGEITEETWDLTLAVNLTAPWRLTQLVLPWFDAAGGGSIVNVSSIEGLRVRPTHAAYAAAKGGLLQLTRTTAVELGHRNIRANAICPGSIDTEMFRQHVDALDDPAAVLDDLVARNHLGRLGRPDEVAAAVVHLLSEEAAFTSGHAYVIDGARIVAT